MEKELNEINNKFQSGKHKDAINELQILIANSSTDNLLYKAYDRLGDYLNFLGQHVEAVESWNNALKNLEDNPGGIEQLNEQKFFDWINISLGIARITHRQGVDGPGVSHKYNSVCYSTSNLDENEKEQWKKEHLETSIKHYRQVLDKLPLTQLETKLKIQIKLAQVLFDAKNFDEAVLLYETAFNNDGNPEWLYKAACCSWEKGNKEQAYTRLEQLIATEPTFANAYKMSADYFQEKNDTIKVDECKRKHNFYSWIPSFCHNIEYNTENVSILEMIQSENALECVETTLANDKSKRATEFLASICYHHYHGSVENKAFELLEKRGKEYEDSERDFIGTILMYLLQNHRSICTIKGAASALAGMKYHGIYEILENLLPQDVNLFPMHIPLALAKLNDERAIPLLIRTIEKPIELENNDSDSSDDFSFPSRLVSESYLALASFINDNRAKETLINGINKENIREICLAVLCVSTEEEQYFEKLEKFILDGNTLDYMVIQYLEDNLNKSQYANKLFNLNNDISKKNDKEQAKQNSDDN